jgi:two-component system chemotaxis response regulator CheY
MKVLLTDDSVTIRMVLKSLLKQLQITDVIEAGSGSEALAKLDKEAVDVVLLDIHMPQMDGLAFLAELRNRPALASLPVVIISSDTGAEQMARATELGVVSSVRKPFRLEGLREALNAAVPARASAKP